MSGIEVNLIKLIPGQRDLQREPVPMEQVVFVELVSQEGTLRICNRAGEVILEAVDGSISLEPIVGNMIRVKVLGVPYIGEREEDKPK